MDVKDFQQQEPRLENAEHLFELIAHSSEVAGIREMAALDPNKPQWLCNKCGGPPVVVHIDPSTPADINTISQNFLRGLSRINNWSVLSPGKEARDVIAT